MPESSLESRPGPAVGRVLREIREARGLSQSTLSRHLDAHGLRWTADQVGAVETGHRDTLTLDEFWLLWSALGALPIPSGVRVRLSPTATVESDSLVKAMSGPRPAVTTFLSTPRAAADFIDAAFWGQLPSEADQHAAGRLGVTPPQVQEASLRTWGHPLHEERERRLQEDKRPPTRAHRGRVTRDLLAQLRETLTTPPPRPTPELLRGTRKEASR